MRTNLAPKTAAEIIAGLLWHGTGYRFDSFKLGLNEHADFAAQNAVWFATERYLAEEFARRYVYETPEYAEVNAAVERLRDRLQPKTSMGKYLHYREMERCGVPAPYELYEEETEAEREANLVDAALLALITAPMVGGQPHVPWLPHWQACRVLTCRVAPAPTLPSSF
jgi:hypothetical protein